MHGERFMLSVIAEGAEPLRYSWTFNGAVLEGQSSSELVVTRALKASHQGLYKAKVNIVLMFAKCIDASRAVPDGNMMLPLVCMKSCTASPLYSGADCCQAVPLQWL